LAALPKGPSVYTPRHDEERAHKRRDLVLSLMADQGFLTRAAADEAIDESLDIVDTGWRPGERDTSTIIDAVRAVVDSALSGSTRRPNLEVRTTIDWSLQRAADRVVALHAEAIEQEREG